MTTHGGRAGGAGPGRAGVAGDISTLYLMRIYETHTTARHCIDDDEWLTVQLATLLLLQLMLLVVVVVVVQVKVLATGSSTTAALIALTRRSTRSTDCDCRTKPSRYDIRARAHLHHVTTMYQHHTIRHQSLLANMTRVQSYQIPAINYLTAVNLHGAFW